MEKNTQPDDMTFARDRVNYLAKVHGAATYLEIGVRAGGTFFNVDLPFKAAVDPCFLFDPKKHSREGTHYYALTSDAFFEAMDKGCTSIQEEYAKTGKKLLFDIIFIDGLHTYEQVKKDFLHSIKFSHAKTIWIIDDTVPCDPVSAINNIDVSIYKRRLYGLPGDFWHGDVYKLIFYIHDNLPGFSYATLMWGNNPQTVVWKAEKRKVNKIYSLTKNIAQAKYSDIIQYAFAFYPLDKNDHERIPLKELVGKVISLKAESQKDVWKKMIYEPFLFPLADKLFLFYDEILQNVYPKR